MYKRQVKELLRLHGGCSGVLKGYEAKYPDGHARKALGEMLRASFPPLAQFVFGRRESPGLVDPNGRMSGSLHPCDLSFTPSSWDLFYVYEGDFLREVKAIVTDGLPQAGLQVQPLALLQDDVAERFGWKPDGEYRVFVRVAAIMFVTITTVEKHICNPSWFCLLYTSPSPRD